MKILTVSDEVKKSFFKEDTLKEKCRGIDHYVPGNHDDKYCQPSKGRDFSIKGCENIDQRVIVFKDLLIGGLAGSFRYKKGKFLYTEEQMHRKILRMYPYLLFNKIRYKHYIDIMITHAPPFGIGILGVYEKISSCLPHSWPYLPPRRRGEKNQLISRYMCY